MHDRHEWRETLPMRIQIMGRGYPPYLAKAIAVWATCWCAVFTTLWLCAGTPMSNMSVLARLILGLSIGVIHRSILELMPRSVYLDDRQISVGVCLPGRTSEKGATSIQWIAVAPDLVRLEIVRTGRRRYRDIVGAPASLVPAIEAWSKGSREEKDRAT